MKSNRQTKQALRRHSAKLADVHKELELTHQRTVSAPTSPTATPSFSLTSLTPARAADYIFNSLKDISSINLHNVLSFLGNEVALQKKLDAHNAPQTSETENESSPEIAEKTFETDEVKQKMVIALFEGDISVDEYTNLMTLQDNQLEEFIASSYEEENNLIDRLTKFSQQTISSSDLRLAQQFLAGQFDLDQCRKIRVGRKITAVHQPASKTELAAKVEIEDEKEIEHTASRKQLLFNAFHTETGLPLSSRDRVFITYLKTQVFTDSNIQAHLTLLLRLINSQAELQREIETHSSFKEFIFKLVNGSAEYLSPVKLEENTKEKTPRTESRPASTVSQNKQPEVNELQRALVYLEQNSNSKNFVKTLKEENISLTAPYSGDLTRIFLMPYFANLTTTQRKAMSLVVADIMDCYRVIKHLQDTTKILGAKQKLAALKRGFNDSQKKYIIEFAKALKLIRPSALIPKDAAKPKFNAPRLSLSRSERQRQRLTPPISQSPTPEKETEQPTLRPTTLELRLEGPDLQTLLATAKKAEEDAEKAVKEHEREEELRKANEAIKAKLSVRQPLVESITVLNTETSNFSLAEELDDAKEEEKQAEEFLKRKKENDEKEKENQNAREKIRETKKALELKKGELNALLKGTQKGNRFDYATQKLELAETIWNYKSGTVHDSGLAELAKLEEAQQAELAKLAETQQAELKKLEEDAKREAELEAKQKVDDLQENLTAHLEATRKACESLVTWAKSENETLRAVIDATNAETSALSACIIASHAQKDLKSSLRSQKTDLFQTLQTTIEIQKKANAALVSEKKSKQNANDAEKAANDAATFHATKTAEAEQARLVSLEKDGLVKTAQDNLVKQQQKSNELEKENAAKVEAIQGKLKQLEEHIELLKVVEQKTIAVQTAEKKLSDATERASKVDADVANRDGEIKAHNAALGLLTGKLEKAELNAATEKENSIDAEKKLTEFRIDPIAARKTVISTYDDLLTALRQTTTSSSENLAKVIQGDLEKRKEEAKNNELKEKDHAAVIAKEESNTANETRRGVLNNYDALEAEQKALKELGVTLDIALAKGIDDAHPIIPVPELTLDTKHLPHPVLPPEKEKEKTKTKDEVKNNPVPPTGLFPTFDPNQSLKSKIVETLNNLNTSSKKETPKTENPIISALDSGFVGRDRKFMEENVRKIYGTLSPELRFKAKLQLLRDLRAKVISHAIERHNQLHQINMNDGLHFIAELNSALTDSVNARAKIEAAVTAFQEKARVNINVPVALLYSDNNVALVEYYVNKVNELLTTPPALKNDSGLGREIFDLQAINLDGTRAERLQETLKAFMIYLGPKVDFTRVDPRGNLNFLISFCLDRHSGSDQEIDFPGFISRMDAANYLHYSPHDPLGLKELINLRNNNYRTFDQSLEAQFKKAKDYFLQFARNLQNRAAQTPDEKQEYQNWINKISRIEYALDASHEEQTVNRHIDNVLRTLEDLLRRAGHAQSAIPLALPVSLSRNREKAILAETLRTDRKISSLSISKIKHEMIPSSVTNLNHGAQQLALQYAELITGIYENDEKMDEKEKEHRSRELEKSQDFIERISKINLDPAKRNHGSKDLYEDSCFDFKETRTDVLEYLAYFMKHSGLDISKIELGLDGHVSVVYSDLERARLALLQTTLHKFKKITTFVNSMIEKYEEEEITARQTREMRDVVEHALLDHSPLYARLHFNLQAFMRTLLSINLKSPHARAEFRNETERFAPFLIDIDAYTGAFINTMKNNVSRYSYSTEETVVTARGEATNIYMTIKRMGSENAAMLAERHAKGTAEAANRAPLIAAAKEEAARQRAAALARLSLHPAPAPQSLSDEERLLRKAMTQMFGRR